MRRAADDAYVEDSLEIDGEDPGDEPGPPIGVLPPDAARTLTIPFRSTTPVPHASLRMRAEVYEDGALEAELERTLPDDPQEATDFPPPPGRIDGLVQSPDGEPLAGVPVTMQPPSGTYRVVTTGADGRFSIIGLEDGTYELSLGGGGAAVVDRRSIEITPADPTAQVTFGLVATELSGVVRLADGTRLANAIVDIYRDDELIDVVDVNGAGGFSALMLRGGTYDLLARHPDIGLARLDDVVVTAGTPATGLQLVAGSGRLQVTTAAGATVGVRPSALRADQSVGRVADAAGQATIDRLAPGPYVVTTKLAGKAPRRDAVTVASTGTTALSAPLSQGAAASGTVTGDGGAPLADAIVWAIDAPSGTASTDRADANGEYAIDTLTSGPVDLWFTAEGYAPKHVTGPVAPGGGTVDVDAALDRDGIEVPFTVKAGSPAVPVMGAEVTVLDPSGQVPLDTAITEPNGEALLGPLPPGTTRVEVQAPGILPVRRDLLVAAAGSTSAGRVPGRPELVDLEPPDRLHKPPRDSYENEDSLLLKFQDPFSPYALPARVGPDANPDWSGSFITIPFTRPCPTPEKTRRNLLQSKFNLDRAFRDWQTAYLAANKLNGADVRLYLLQSTRLANKLAALGVAISAFQAAAALTFEQTLGVVAAANITRQLGIISDAVLNARTSDGPQGPVTLGSFFDPSTFHGGTIQAAVAGIVDLVSDTPYAGAAVALASIYKDGVALNEDIQKHYDKNFIATDTGYRVAEKNYKDALLRHYRLINLLKAQALDCPKPNEPKVPDDPTAPTPSGSTVVTIDNVAPHDPNDIDGPAGIDNPTGGANERWIRPDGDLGYAIRFENIGPGTINPPGPPATAPAVLVTVTHQLAPAVDLDSFQLGSLGWGDVEVEIPAGLQAYHGEVQLEDGDSVYVDAALDRPSREVTWRLETIDPDTGELEDDPEGGFLPPESGNGDGQGRVTYTARLLDNVAHGATVPAQARIVFDFNPPIDTPVWTNTVDRQRPQGTIDSVVQPGNANGGGGCEQSLDVSWSGSDVGSGLDLHAILVSENGGPYEPWLAATSATDGTLETEPGSSYAFVNAARDEVGNERAVPPDPDAKVRTVPCDAAPPSVRIGAPAVGATVSQGSVLRAEYSCSDSLSGVDTCAGTVASGASLPTDTPGKKSLTVTARDLAGNQATATRTYTVTESVAPPPPPPPPADGVDFGSDLKVTVTLGKMKKPKAAAVTVANGYAFPVTGSIRLLAAKKVKGKRQPITGLKPLSIAAGATEQLKLKLKRTAKRVLSAGKKFKAVAAVEVKNSAGQTRNLERKLKLKVRKR